MAQLHPLEYQDRGKWLEGIVVTPVTDETVELLSARADFFEPSRQWPEFVRIKFFLPPPQKTAFLTVRDLDDAQHYRLAEVKIAWLPGENSFEWSTQPVLRHLTDMRISDLGIVVQTDSRLLGPSVTVAPAILFHSVAPTKIDRYLFVFRFGRDVEISWQVFRSDSGEVVFKQEKKHYPGATLITVQSWDAASMPDGQYRLRVQGRFLGGTSGIEQNVSFFHRTSWTKR